MKFNPLSQSKGIPWLGAAQVQIINSMIYLSFMNFLMLAFTTWNTSGYPMTRQYAPWVNMWIFFGFLAGGFIFLMMLDYKFMYPSRVEHNNRQAYKQKNPAVDDLKAIRRDVAILVRARRHGVRRARIHERRHYGHRRHYRNR